MKKNFFTLLICLFFVIFPYFLNAQNKDVNWKQLLKDFDEIAIKSMKEEKIPGMAIGVVLGDKVIYLKGFGVKKEGTDDKVDPDTVFQLASVSKPLTSTVVAAAVSQGALSWDDKIKMYVPTFAMKDDWVTREFTITDALAHRSGLKAFAADDLEMIGYNLNEIIERLKYLEPESSFRSKYAYQNMIITIGGLAAANAAKKDFNILAKEVLFDPLNMKNSGFFFADYQNAKNKAYSYVKDEKGNWVSLYTRTPDVQFGGGGASSTARDLSNWLIMYLNNGKFNGRQVIAEKDLFAAHTPEILSSNTADKTSFYALGMGIEYDNKGGNLIWKHSGAFTTGIRSIVFMIPEAKLGLVVLTNVFPSGVPEGLAQALNVLYKTGDKAHAFSISYKPSGGLSFLYKVGEDKEKAISTYDDVSHLTSKGIQLMAEQGGNGKTAVENPKPQLPLDQYVGTYNSNYYDTLEVKPSDGGIEAYVGKYRVKLTLKHYDGNVFSYKFNNLAAQQEETGLLTFTLDDKGNVVGAKISGFDGGTFSKVPSNTSST